MTEGRLTTSHLSVAMTTTEVDKTSTTDGMTSSFSVDAEFYFELAVAFMGVVGTAGNALILYALVASKQHRKHLLIVNQNALDLFSSFFLLVVYALKLCNLRLSGDLGLWLCITLLSEYPIWLGTNGSVINLAIVTADRYLKGVHPTRSRKCLRPWVIYCAVSFAWVASTAYCTVGLLMTSALVDGQCLGYSVFVEGWHGIAVGIGHISFFI